MTNLAKRLEVALFMAHPTKIFQEEKYPAEFPYKSKKVARPFLQVRVPFSAFRPVAHLPDKANNYLTPALSVLEKNT
ncbi:hypothetical protein TRIUR3_30725 [Triticum urartu]|uniref:Uncharacterized protein n=1 Tax=Triticum urartu TaxID=4572 RepID=M8A7L7_TRIUA|nr:hypothetical protein TRIUR3_30725 [Triticum urartu]